MTTLVFTPKEIHIMVQLIQILIEMEIAFEYAKPAQLEVIKSKLQDVKD